MSWKICNISAISGKLLFASIFHFSPLLVFSEASPIIITIVPIAFSVLFKGSNQVNQLNQ
jgi:hypothetical protein